MGLFCLFIIIWIVGGIFSFCSIMAVSINDGRKPGENFPTKEDMREALGFSIIAAIISGPFMGVVGYILGWVQKSGGLLFWRYDRRQIKLKNH